MADVYTPPINKKGFIEERRYLSNMFEVPICYDGDVYNSSEAIYMLFKNDSLEWKKFILNNKPSDIKKESRNIKLVSDWEIRKIPAMRLALTLKFSQHPSLFKKLQEEKELIEWNWWNDLFWGKDHITEEGLNNLGILLEEISCSKWYQDDLFDDF